LIGTSTGEQRALQGGLKWRKGSISKRFTRNSRKTKGEDWLFRKTNLSLPDESTAVQRKNGLAEGKNNTKTGDKSMVGIL